MMLIPISLARHQFTWTDHEHKTSASRTVPVFVVALLVLIAPNHEGMARLS